MVDRSPGFRHNFSNTTKGRTLDENRDYLVYPNEGMWQRKQEVANSINVMDRICTCANIITRLCSQKNPVHCHTMKQLLTSPDSEEL